MKRALGPALTALVLIACRPGDGGPASPPDAGAAEASASAPLDLVLANGRVVDGTGAPWFRADVGIRGDRIEAIGDLSARAAARRVDLHDRMVAPGFIDMLGQSETNVLIDNRVESKIRQGITTEITGEGQSVAPTNDALLAEAKPYLDRFHLAIDWRDLAGYRRRFDAGKSTINLGTFVGAASVRSVVLGLGDVQPTAAQLAEMVKVVDQAMEQGALGVSTALIYPPATYAKTPELIALAKAASRRGGIYASHIRSESDKEPEAIEEALTIAREASIPVEIYHLKVAGKDNWGKMKDVVARLERARAEGIDVTADMYPYVAAMNGLAASLPDWAADGGIDAMIARFHDPPQRERIKKEMLKGGLGREQPEDILLVSCVEASLQKYMGKRLSEVAKEMGKSAEDALIDLVEADKANISVVRFVMGEDDVELGLRQPWVSFCTDAPGQALDGPFAKELTHPRAFGGAARLIGHYARDRKLFSIEEAVRKMTSLPARRVRLGDRGLLRPGMMADVTVFDPGAIRDAATFEQPLRHAEGVEYVVVSGKLVLDAGTLTSERPGRFLARQ